MTVRALKDELDSRRISWQGVFEKEGLIKLLLQARHQPDEVIQQKSEPIGKTSRQRHVEILQAPLLLTTAEQSRRVPAANLDNGGITLGNNLPPFAFLEVRLGESDKSPTLSLLLDTACSGVVLRPSIVKKYNLPPLRSTVTMTGAGGSSGAASGLTQLPSFYLDHQRFEPLLAAVQDIGALSERFDGIIGLSFLNQFSQVELDFEAGVISFCRDEQTLSPLSDREIVAEGVMRELPGLNIFTVEVTFGGRGPVQMLVDSGAAFTVLNWHGVSALGLSRDSKFLSPTQQSKGAMGSDNIAIQLSHCLNVSSNMNLGGLGGSLPGVSLSGLSRRLSVDIGQIPILDGLAPLGVGGILGIDAMMRSTAIRLYLKGSKRIVFLK